MKISDRIGNLSYAIREVDVISNKLKREGKHILKFNLGDPNRHDFDVPSTMQNNLVKAVSSHSGYYSESVGEESVRSKIAIYEAAKYNINLDPQDVIFTNGVSEGILFSFLSLMNPFDQILVPQPGYPAYNSVGTITQVETVEYNTLENEGWMPDVNDMRSKITKKTRGIVIVNPNNPTGAVYNKKILKEIVDLAGEFDLFLISDEIYDLQILNQKKTFNSISTINKDVPALIMNGFSKNYLSPGWRAGYLYRVDPENKLNVPFDGIKKLCRVRLSPNTPISVSAAQSLNIDPPHLKDMLSKIKERRDYVVKRFNEIERITTTVPDASFYIFPKLHLSGTRWNNSKDFVLDLIREKQVLLVYGSGFGGELCKNHFRMVYLSPLDKLEEGINRIEQFLLS